MKINGYTIAPETNLRWVDLTRVNLEGANLKGVNLYGADLTGASLRWANLKEANLKEANLKGANLKGANLKGANLGWANLKEVNLQEADLEGANLTRANLTGADLEGANLEGADLYGADLERVNLEGALNIPDHVVQMTNICPEGDLIGWKKLRDGVICKLLIPAAARRSNATTRKCRAEWAVVLEGEGVSRYESPFVYRVGETVRPTQPFNPDRWAECTSGIHFFLTREDAEAY